MRTFAGILREPHGQWTMRELADLASPPELGAKLKLYCDPLWSGRPAFVAEMLSYAASGVPPPHAWCADALCIFLRVVAKLSDRVVGMVKDAKLSGADFLRLSRRAITNLTTSKMSWRSCALLCLLCDIFLVMIIHL